MIFERFRRKYDKRERKQNVDYTYKIDTIISGGQKRIKDEPEH